MREEGKETADFDGITELTGEGEVEGRTNLSTSLLVNRPFYQSTCLHENSFVRRLEQVFYRVLREGERWAAKRSHYPPTLGC